MANKTRVTVHPAFPIGDISERLYGTFLEPIGTMVNGSMYNPKHPTADEQGFRTDYINALREAGLKAIRLPGGNFVSGWDWKDSIGPMEERKCRLDLAWHQYIPNDVGHDEYLQWAEKTGGESMYTINLGTGDINDAMKIVEYTNHLGGSFWSDLRRKYGHDKPYNVKIWYLGNEMDGPWQIASWEKDPRGYGIRAHEVSKAMKWIDNTIETAVCGSSSPFQSHYPEWDREVLEQCYDTVDYVSLHHYHSAPEGDWGALLGGNVYFEDYINTEIGLCDYIQTKNRSDRKMLLSFDEYGISARAGEPPVFGYGVYNKSKSYYPQPGQPYHEYVRHDPDNMGAGRFRPGGDMLGALGFAAVQMVFFRHADRVKIGCMTGGLGALCATDHDHVWKNATYYPYAQLMRYGRGMSMRTSIEGDTFDIPAYAVNPTSEYPPRFGITFIEGGCAFNDEDGELTVFLINRDWENDREVELDVSGFEGYKFVEHIQLYSDDMNARNTYDDPDAVAPSVNGETKCADGILSAKLKKLSWNVLRFEK